MKLVTNRYTIVPTNESTYYAYNSAEWLSFDLKDTYIQKVEDLFERTLHSLHSVFPCIFKRSQISFSLCKLFDLSAFALLSH